MEQFEYKTMLYEPKVSFFSSSVDRSELDNMLNWMGAKSWELVSAVSQNEDFGDTKYIVCIFKRRCVYEEGVDHGN